ncbi:MAG: type IV toxin-antitoxin system AbiEi family antitoxin domain-containing protein [Anaerolineae bacterium]
MRRDPQENLQQLYALAEAQGGYFTAAQARKAGYAYSQQHFHVARGTWVRVERGIFRLRNFPPDEHEDLIRLTLWSRTQQGQPQVVASHETALALHALSDVLSARIHLTAPPGFRKPAPSGCVLHRAALAAAEIEVRTGYRVTTPLRTLLDVADSPLSQEHLDKAVSQALERGMVRRAALETAPCTPTARQRLTQALASAPRITELQA